MAKFNTVGFDEVEKELLLASEKASKAVTKMLEAGADIIMKAHKTEAKAMKIEDTGEFIKSIKKSKVLEKNTSKRIEIRPTGKDSKGVRNEEKGYIAEYGKKAKEAKGKKRKFNQGEVPARPWMETANLKSEEEVHQAMKKIWEE